MIIRVNETTKTCIVQTFFDAGYLSEIITATDCFVRDFINDKQKDYWFIQHIQHNLTIDDIDPLLGKYIVHLVMSRMYD
jgi:hypothetical protein